MGWNYYDTKTLPRVYDIVWCLFPVGEDGRTGPKLRPGLVRLTQRNADGTKGAVVVSYGTTQLRLGYRNHDFVIQNAAEIARLGLTAATRFDLGRMARLLWAGEFFCAPPHANQICTGSLSEEQIARLRRKLAQRSALGIDN